MKKRLFSILLALTLCLTMLPATALAEESVTEVATAAELNTAVAGSGSIKLTDNIALDSAVEISGNVTIDLNGKSITPSSAWNVASGSTYLLAVKHGGALTIKDSIGSGKIDAAANATGNNDLLTNGYAKKPWAAVIMTAESESSTEPASLTVERGTLIGKYYAIVGNGSDGRGNTSITINGGTIKGTVKKDSYAIYHPQQNGTLTITGGEFTGEACAIEMRSGTLNISGGTFTSTADAFSCNPNGNGTTTAGAAIAVAQHTTKKDISVAISGGTFEGVKALNESNPQENDPAPNAAISITGGTFNGAINITDNKSTTIEGGTFSDLASAVQYAKDGASIKLANDVTVDSTIEVAKRLTIDLNGKTITGESDGVGRRVFNIVGGGDLTLTGTGTVTTANKNDDDATNKSFPHTSSVIRIGSNTATGSANLTVDRSVSIIAPVSHSITIFGKEQTVSLTVKGTVKCLYENCAAIVGNGSSGLSATAITVEPTAVLYSAHDYAIYHPQSGTLTINGGTITGVGGIEAKAGSTTVTVSGDPVITATGTTSHTANGSGSSTKGYALVVVENSGYSGGATMNIASGHFTGAMGIKVDNTVEENKKGSISITGGYFTADPSAYVRDGSYVHPSDKSGYTYMVNSTAPEEGATPIYVAEDTNVTIPEGSTLSDEDKANITNNTSVSGTDQALKKDQLVDSKVTDTQLADAKQVVVSVEVAVKLTDADATEGTLTFTATPTATISTVGENGTSSEVATDVEVTNSMLNGQPITVKLPLPEGFTPKQIKHVSEGYATEYFLNKDSVGSKRGAKTFEVIDGCAVFQITHFSEFVLSGDVTYTEPPVAVSKPAHDVDVKKAANGSVSVNQDEARQGSIVTVTVAPDSGYTLESLTVLDKNGNALKLNALGGNKYSFIMPDGDVTVRASFTNGGDAAFVDVPAGKYFTEPVAWAVASGITGGTDATHFSPYASCTRGQLVTFLWRAAGEPAAEGAKGFSDVKSTSSFYRAILWAAENGIVGGYADGTFHPNAAVTRQQVAAILYRYAKYAKMDVSVGEDTNILSFNDAFEISEYAIPAFQWAVGENVITGNDGSLLPHDTCTRAQIVTMLYRLLAD